MYKMKADGVVFYDPASDDMTLQVLSPKASYELNQPGSLEFTLLPGSVVYDSLHKLKTVVTLEQDGELIFRGRVLETVTDIYNQKEVYCEGELAFLLDSIQRTYEFKGKAADLFRQLVTRHNEQVEEYKQFQIGTITAVNDDDTLEVESDSYSATLADIQSLLLDQFGGYLRIRHEGGARYIDYVDTFNQTCSQEITFGVNILDIENKVNAQEVCTVLVPLGKDSLTISDVNGGKDYIEDAELIAQYGRIVKSYTWDDVKDAEKLLYLGQEHMRKMKADTTLTITAFDLRAAGADVDGIRIGDTVRLNSQPHGLDKQDICAQIELDIERPEKSEYTFGLPRETLTSAHASAVKSMADKMWHQHKWLTETDDEASLRIKKVNLIGHTTSDLQVKLDAANKEILLRATVEDVNVLGESLKEAIITLNGSEGEITAKADKIDLQGYVTMEDFEAGIGEIETGFSEYIMTGEIDAGTAEVGTLVVTGNAAIPHASCGTLEVNGDTLTKHSLKVVTGIDVVTSLEGRITAVQPITAQINYYA